MGALNWKGAGLLVYWVSPAEGMETKGLGICKVDDRDYNQAGSVSKTVGAQLHWALPLRRLALLWKLFFRPRKSESVLYPPGPIVSVKWRPPAVSEQ